MYPHIFCFEHVTYIILFSLFMFISIYFFLHSVKPQFYIYIIKSFALVNLMLTLWNRLAITNYKLFTLSILPPSFCSTTALLGGIGLLFLKPNSKTLHFLLFSGGLTGFFVTLFPDYIAQNISFFYDKTFSSLLYHTGMFYLFILTLKLKYFIPQRKSWIIVPLGLIPYYIWGYIGNTYLGHANNMYLKKSPLPYINIPWYLVAFIFLIIYTAVLFRLDKTPYNPNCSN